jgi:hypothetical protein
MLTSSDSVSELHKNDNQRSYLDFLAYLLWPWCLSSLSKREEKLPTIPLYKEVMLTITLIAFITSASLGKTSLNVVLGFSTIYALDWFLYSWLCWMDQEHLLTPEES